MRIMPGVRRQLEIQRAAPRALTVYLCIQSVSVSPTGIDTIDALARYPKPTFGSSPVHAN